MQISTRSGVVQAIAEPSEGLRTDNDSNAQSIPAQGARSLPSRAQARVRRKRSPGNERARIGQIKVRKGARLEEGAQRIIPLVEQIPRQAENLDVPGDLIR